MWFYIVIGSWHEILYFSDLIRLFSGQRRCNQHQTSGAFFSRKWQHRSTSCLVYYFWRKQKGSALIIRRPANFVRHVSFWAMQFSSQTLERHGTSSRRVRRKHGIIVGTKLAVWELANQVSTLHIWLTFFHKAISLVFFSYDSGVMN